MRYVAVALAVLCLAVAVGQDTFESAPSRSRLGDLEDRTPDRAGGDEFGDAGDGFTPRRESQPAAGDGFAPLADSNPTIPGLPPVLPLKEGQAAKLREAIRLTQTATDDLETAAGLFREGGTEDGAQRCLKLAESARKLQAEVSTALKQREDVISQRLHELEAEVSRLKEELRRTQEKPEAERREESSEFPT